MKKTLSLLLALVLVFLLGAFAESDAPALEKDLVVLFTSDVHCGIEEGFGYTGLYAIYQTLSQENHVILVDDGDAIQGDAIGTVTKGSAINDLMNTLGYEIAIPGNHEFDYGMDTFLSIAEKANFPYISCNFNKNGELVFAPYVIKEYDGVKVGFVGVTTPTTLTTSTPKYFQDENGNYVYGFMNDESGEALYTAIQTAVDSAREDGANYIVVMGHLGNEAACSPWNYADVISNTTGINALLDGHSHDTDKVVMSNKNGEDVLRLACGTKLSGVGYLTIKTDGSLDGGVYNWNNSVSAPALLGISNEISTAVNGATAELDTKLEEVVANTSFDLTIYDPEAVDENGKPIRIVRRAETNLADLCADAYRDQSGADIAFINGGGVRANIDAGDITVGGIIKVHPFGNTLCVAEVTGQQILDALEFGARAVPSELGGFIQVSGLTYEIHTYVESTCTTDENGMFTGVSGEYRVKNVMVGDEALKLDKIYSLASTSYILKNSGDGMCMFAGSKITQDEVMIDNQALINYITETLNGVITEEYQNPYGTGRIVAVESANN